VLLVLPPIFGEFLESSGLSEEAIEGLLEERDVSWKQEDSSGIERNLVVEHMCRKFLATFEFDRGFRIVCIL